MALFSRRPKTPTTVPDEAFPFWEQLVADEFRALATAGFRAAGVEVTVFGDHVVAPNGTQYGLSNLAATCHQADGGRRAWKSLVFDHARELVSAMNGPSAFDRLSQDQVLASTYCRLLATEDLLPLTSYARSFAPGLAVVLNLDLPRTVSYFTDDHVRTFGEAALTERGMMNLRKVKPDEHNTLERDGGVIEVLLGESVFTASLALLLDEVVQQYGFDIDPANGALFGVPNRNQLDFHVLRDASAAASLRLLAGFTAAGHRDAPGSVSPAVFWWRPSEVQAISRLDGDGITIEVGPDLADVLNRLTG